MCTFEKHPITEMPESVRGGWPGRKPSPLTIAIRDLGPDDTIFVPSDGHPLKYLQQSLLGRFHDKEERHKYTTRSDRERNGVWVFLRQNGGSA